MGHRAAIPYPRSRRSLRNNIQRSSGDDEYRRSADGAAIAVAERLCRARHRIDPAGVPRSCHCPERASLATDPVVLFRLLSRIPYTPVARQGHAGPPISSADRFREDRGISTGRRSASPIRAPRGLIGGGFRFCVESGDQGAEPLATSSSALSSLPTHHWAAKKNGWRTVLGNFYGSIASRSTPTTASRFASVTGMR